MSFSGQPCAGLQVTGPVGNGRRDRPPPASGLPWAVIRALGKKVAAPLQILAPALKTQLVIHRFVSRGRINLQAP